MHFQSRTRPITWSTNSVDDFFLEKKTTYKEWIGYYSLIVIACVCVHFDSITIASQSNKRGGEEYKADRR